MEGQRAEDHTIFSFYCYIFNECVNILCLSIKTLGYEGNVFGVNEFHNFFLFILSPGKSTGLGISRVNLFFAFQ